MPVLFGLDDRAVTALNSEGSLFGGEAASLRRSQDASIAPELDLTRERSICRHHSRVAGSQDPVRAYPHQRSASYFLQLGDRADRCAAYLPEPRQCLTSYEGERESAIAMQTAFDYKATSQRTHTPSAGGMCGGAASQRRLNRVCGTQFTRLSRRPAHPAFGAVITLPSRIASDGGGHKCEGYRNAVPTDA